MSVRQDKVQIKVEFITDESKQLAKTILDTKTLGNNLSDAQKELEKYRKEVEKAGDDEKKRAAAVEKVAAAERKVEDALKGIAAAGKQAEKIDLSKVAPAQLAERARQLREALKFAPSNTAEAANFRAELQRINTQTATLTRQTKALDNNDGPSGFFGRFGPLIGKAAGLIGVFTAAYQGLKSVIAGANEMEQLSISFETFLGSADTAKKTIQDLKAFEVKTPFEAEQVYSAGRALLAFGVSTRDLIPTLTRIGDVAAGTGKDFNELAIIYGKAKTQGLIQGEELNQLAEAGIPIYQELAKVLGVSEDKIRKLGEQGKIQFNDLDQVFQNLTSTGGRFSGLMEKQSQSIGGLLSTLKSQFDNLLADIGTQLLPTIKEITVGLSGFLKEIGPIVSNIVSVLKSVDDFINTKEGGILGKAIQTTLNPLRAVYEGYLDLKKRIFGETQQASAEIAAAAIPAEISPEEKARLEADEKRRAEIRAAAARKEAEAAAERARKAFEAALAKEEAQQKKEELILENRRINGRISEDQYWVDLNTVTEDGLKKRLDVYKKFYQQESVEAFKLQNELDQLVVTREEFREARTVEILQTAIDTEVNYEIKSLDFKKAANNEALALMQAHAAAINEEDKKNKKELLKNEQELERERQKIRQESFKATADIFGLVADILERDEAAQKKNASVVKAFKKAEITINSIAEISAIYKNAQTSIEGGILGPAGAYGLATVQALVAAGRAALAINNIEKTKLERGRVFSFGRGKSGIFGGQPHSSGGTKGWFSDGTQVEVEKDEAWAVVNKKNTPILQMLSNVNALNGNGDPYFQNGGVMRFNTGGLPNFNTTPSSTAPPAGISFQNSDSSGSMERAAALIYAAAQMMPREVQAKVNYLDIESAGTELASIRNDASI